MNEIFKFLDGKTFTLSGVHGKFRHETYLARYPYEHTIERLVHDASAEGKQSKVYREIRRTLKDDWSTELTDNIERYCEIAIALGYKME